MSKRLTRVLTTLVAVLALVAATAACGGDQDADEPAAGDGEISGEIKLLTPIFEGADGKEALEGEVLANFNAQYPDVEVVVEYTTYGDLNEKLVTALASGLVPDVMMMGVGWVEGFADQGVLADLDQFGLTVDAAGDQYTPEVLQAGVWEDSLYALPIMLDARLGIYRADIFEQEGIEPPGPTWTWEEMREAAIALTERDASGNLERAGLDILSWDPRRAAPPPSGS
ncbi:MAG: ABC transporter substrate-binding protein [Acidimicrobiales bacterium]